MKRRRARRLALAVAAILLVAAGAFAAAPPRPTPKSEAVPDGCERNPTGLYTSESPNWAYVRDRLYPAEGPAPPPQWLKGVVSAKVDPFLASHPAGGDNPFTHLTHDEIVNVRPDVPYAFLMGGDPAERIGNFAVRGEGTERVHTEWETAAFRMFAWPEKGDRIEMLGSWVWDCDHFDPEGEHTELHPSRAVWVVRNPGGVSARSPFGETEGDLFVSTDKTPAGTQADCAHRAKGDRALFRRCVRSDRNWQDVNGRYRFFLPAPPRPSAHARLRVRLVDRGTTPGFRVRTSLRRSPPGVSVVLDVDEPEGRRVVVAKQVFVGWRPTPARALPMHLRVSFRRLLVRRAMDPGCPSPNAPCSTPQTTLGGQTTRPPGEWVVYWNVAGIWGPWKPALLRPRDGQSFPGTQTVDLYVARGEPWRLYMFARECDFAVSAAGGVPMRPCPKVDEIGAAQGDETAGSVVRQFRSPAASLGFHRADALVAASTCPPINRRGCYTLEFEVRRVHDEAQRARAARD